MKCVTLLLRYKFHAVGNLVCRFRLNAVKLVAAAWGRQEHCWSTRRRGPGGWRQSISGSFLLFGKRKTIDFLPLSLPQGGSRRQVLRWYHQRWHWSDYLVQYLSEDRLCLFFDCNVIVHFLCSTVYIIILMSFQIVVFGSKRLYHFRKVMVRRWRLQKFVKYLRFYQNVAEHFQTRSSSRIARFSLIISILTSQYCQESFKTCVVCIWSWS